MRRSLMTSFVVLACTWGFQSAIGAQSTETKTKVKTEDAKMMSFTGCVGAGTETRTFVLNHVVPVSKSETVGTSGTVTTTTTYALVPEEKVELQQQVGHKVEVTGVLIPAGKGDAKIETKTKTEGSEDRSKAEYERGPMPQLKVISVKQLAESCS